MNKGVYFSILLSLLFQYSELSAQRIRPDVDLVSEIVQQKQEEIKNRILKNLVVKNIETTNYTTYNTMYNLLDILTTEKNKTVMTESIIIEVSNYSINYALANVFIDHYYAPSTRTDVGTYSGNILDTLLLKGVKTVYNDKKSTIQQVQDDPESLFANYVIDNLYERLVASNIPILKNKGLFLQSDNQNRFQFGLDLSYNKLEESLRSDVDRQLEAFILNLTAYDQSHSEVFLLLENNNFTLVELEDVSKKNIELLFNLFSFSLSEFDQQIGQNSFLAKIGKHINKYVIFISYEGDNEMVFKNFKIDVESVILSFEEEFTDKGITSLKNFHVGIKPFFIIGMNYGIFQNDNATILNDDGSGKISQISFVGEKIGFKFIFADFDYTRSHKPLEWYKYKGKYRRWKGPQSDPLINDIYISIFGSGILYNVVDLKSEDNFNFGILGLGTGVSFFNDLELNISYSVPIIENKLSYDNAFINLGFDIPIFEYLRALRNKN